MKQKNIIVHMKVNKVFLGLSTNIGEKDNNLKVAIEEIKDFSEVINISSYYKTPPYGYLDQDDFLNMAMEITTELTPLELIFRIHEIEHKMGRVRKIKNGPRIIDIDILLFNDEVINQTNLKIPHPEMHKRNFVLKPLDEIAPSILHPILKENINTLKINLKNPDKVELWTKKN